jgi:predicted transcriptional regulator
MNRIEISVLTPAAALRAFAETWHGAEAGREVRPRLAFGSLHDLFEAVTERRLDLMRQVAAHAGLNARQVAQALGRAHEDVAADVTALVELGLLERDGSGTLSAPYDEILIHAGIRDAA